ncbi:GNAT family N-acetyltransferase [Pseudooctadecabacter jejudonensis]|uniref:GNAT family N-acetyltransferase n=1 Tax=Pseudooctadecabacter jejudonensis TaxID=1391910 RepID=UPI0013563958|nr:GNAT family N-acetyltransferase [Pseudooctadecabacter jejudonensis]
MSWRRVAAQEVAEVEAFLLAHIETSVFLVSNLRRFGPDGADHPRAMTYWITGDPVSGVIAQSSAGVVMAQWPEADDWHAAVDILPHPITGAIGHGAQMNAMLRAAGIRDGVANLDAAEVLYALDLEALEVPNGVGTLRPLTEHDRTVVHPWRTDYAINILGEPEAKGPARADAEISAYIEADSHRLLVDGDAPVSMTGFNAWVDDVVQVGGVYTPPALRGRGLARRAVALHLQAARAEGARRAILFANDPSALAAYEAIGFQPIGDFALIMFQDGQTPR